MPSYNFECVTHGKQERFGCKYGQQTIKCNRCEEQATRLKGFSPSGFTVKGNGAYDNGKFKAK